MDHVSAGQSEGLSKPALDVGPLYHGCTLDVLASAHFWNQYSARKSQICRRRTTSGIRAASPLIATIFRKS